MAIVVLYKEDVLSTNKKIGEITIESFEHTGARFATLYKHVDINTGKLRVPSGWATDQPHLSQLMIIAADWEVDPDKARIILIEKNDGRQWLTTVEKFMEHGFHIDRGFGSQQALVDKHWDDLLTPGSALGSDEPNSSTQQLGFDL